MSEIVSGVIKFLNHSFSKFKTLTQISELNYPEYIDKVLRGAENNFFKDMNYLPSDSDLKNNIIFALYTTVSHPIMNTWLKSL